MPEHVLLNETPFWRNLCYKITYFIHNLKHPFMLTCQPLHLPHNHRLMGKSNAKFKKRSRPYPMHKRFKAIFDKTEKSIWEKMKLLRKERGLLQKEWAAKLDVGLNYVRAYESGRYTPSHQLRLVVCDWLQVSLDWLCGRTDVRFKELSYNYTERRDYDNVLEELRETVVTRLRSLREEKGFTQVSWAEELNLDNDYFRTYEPQKLLPSVSVIVIIADYCNVSLDWIYGRTEVRDLM